MESVTGIVDFLKMEHIGCSQRGETWDAYAIQNLILEFLQHVGKVHGPALTARCVSKVATVFGKIDGRQQSDTNGSLDSRNSTENFLFELDDEITATMAVTTSMDQSAFENFAFNCKEEWEEFVTVLSIS